MFISDWTSSFPSVLKQTGHAQRPTRQTGCALVSHRLLLLGLSFLAGSYACPYPSTRVPGRSERSSGQLWAKERLWLTGLIAAALVKAAKAFLPWWQMLKNCITWAYTCDLFSYIMSYTWNFCCMMAVRGLYNIYKGHQRFHLSTVHLWVLRWNNTIIE